MAGNVDEYTIIDGDDVEEVKGGVNNLLDHGWELYGELKVTAVVANYGSGTGDEEVRVIYRYSQAMTFREPDEAVGA